MPSVDALILLGAALLLAAILSSKLSTRIGIPTLVIFMAESAVIAMLVRGQEMIPPRGSTAIESGDHVFVVLKPPVRPLLDAAATVGDVEEFYGIHLDPNPARTLGDLMVERLGDELTEGARIDAGEFRMAARTVVDGAVTHVDVEVLRDVDSTEG